MPLTAVSVSDDGVVVTWFFEEPSERVWAGLVGAEALPLWLGRPLEADIEVGGMLVVDHGDDTVSRSELRVVEATRALAMSWVFPEEPESEVAIELRESGAGTVLELTHGRLGRELADSYAPGWITHLTYLEAAVAREPLPMDRFWRLHRTHDVLLGRSSSG